MIGDSDGIVDGDDNNGNNDDEDGEETDVRKSSMKYDLQ